MPKLPKTAPRKPIRGARPSKEHASRARNRNESVESQSALDATKKRGPGRPPKDGIMSKKERKERDKCKKLGIPYGDKIPDHLKTKTKLPSKEPKKTRANGVKSGVKRKRDGEDSDSGNEEDNKDDSRPREPSPKREDYTEEQLRKPDQTYYDQLHRILSEAGRPIALPAIYEAMKKTWAHYRFKEGGAGWESSVRHNLQQHEGRDKAFLKGERFGKGYLWKLNPDFRYEAKSKKTVPSFSRPHPYGPHTNVPFNPNASFQPQLSNSYQPQWRGQYPQPLQNGGGAKNGPCPERHNVSFTIHSTARETSDRRPNAPYFRRQRFQAAAFSSHTGD